MSFCSRTISAAGLILLLLEENPDDASIAGIGILAASAARAGAAASEGFGDRVSGQAIGAVRAAHRLAGGEEVRHGRLHVRAGAHAAHV